MIRLASCACTSACLFSALGLKSLHVDPTLGTDSALVRMTAAAATITLHGDLEGGAAGESQVLPLGHQHPDCPVYADDGLESQPARNLRAASVAVAIDPADRVLLTRRPASMRSFPRAWVMAGGRVDETDASLAHAAVRELHEETGLVVSSEQLQPIGIWESAFPTTFAEWRAKRLSGERTAHFCITYFHVPVADAAAPLTLEPQECDCACWVPIDQLLALCDADGGSAQEAGLCFERAPGSPAGPPVPASQLAGVYPNALGEGVGRGHLWALRQLTQPALTPDISLVSTTRTDAAKAVTGNE